MIQRYIVLVAMALALVLAVVWRSVSVRGIPGDLRDAPAAYGDVSEKMDHFSGFLETAPDIQDFLNEWPSDQAGDNAKRFAEAAHHSHAVREQEWTLFNDILGGRAGGRRLGDLRRDLLRLPPEDWYFVIRLEHHRGGIFRMSGNGYVGNVAQNIMIKTGDDSVDFSRYGRKCYERADRLIGLMDIVRNTGAGFHNWTSRNVIARIGKATEHTAPCFVYDGGGGRVEIVADPWANSLGPARDWWRKWENGAFNGSPDGWCGAAYEEYEKQKLDDLLHPDRKPRPQSGTAPKPRETVKQLQNLNW